MSTQVFREFPPRSNSSISDVFLPAGDSVQAYLPPAKSDIYKISKNVEITFFLEITFSIRFCDFRKILFFSARVRGNTGNFVFFPKNMMFLLEYAHIN